MFPPIFLAPKKIFPPTDFGAKHIYYIFFRQNIFFCSKRPSPPWGGTMVGPWGGGEVNGVGRECVVRPSALRPAPEPHRPFPLFRQRLNSDPSGAVARPPHHTHPHDHHQRACPRQWARFLSPVGRGEVGGGGGRGLFIFFMKSVRRGDEEKEVVF